MVVGAIHPLSRRRALAALAVCGLAVTLPGGIEASAQPAHGSAASNGSHPAASVPAFSPAPMSRLIRPFSEVSKLEAEVNIPNAEAERVTYTLRFKVHGGLESGTGFVVLKAPKGTDWTGSSIEVIDGKKAASAGRNPEGEQVTIFVPFEVLEGDTVEVKAYGVTNPEKAVTGELQVSTSTDTTPVGTKIEIGPAKAVTAVSSEENITNAEAERVTYTAKFKATGKLTFEHVEGLIRLKAPKGTDWTGSSIEVIDGKKAASAGRNPEGEQVTIFVPFEVLEGDTVEVKAYGVTNPEKAVTGELQVSTSTDTTPVGTKIEIGPAKAVTAVSSEENITNAEAERVTYTAKFKATGKLTFEHVEGLIRLKAPKGTDWTGSSIEVIDGKKAAGAGRNPEGEQVTIFVPFEVLEGDTVEVKAEGVTNGPTSLTGAKLIVSTSTDATGVAAEFSLREKTGGKPPSGEPEGGGSTETSSSSGQQGVAPFHEEAQAPVLGKRAAVKALAGTVLVKVPGSNGFVALSSTTSVPIGTVVDATKGHVQLCTATKAAGVEQCAEFYGGKFELIQKPGSASTHLVLTGGNFAGCPASRPGAAHQAKRKTTRKLWGNGHGSFTIDGRNSSATVRGTVWSVEDRCTETITRVAKGIVVVLDYRLKRSVVLHAGRTYVAKAH